MTVLEAAKNRTSYRGAFKDTPVPREDLVKIMEAGLSAPTGSNKQTTSLIGIDDQELLKKLYEVVKFKGKQTAPAMICVLTEQIIAYTDGNGVDRCYNVHDYSAAIENMLLAIISMGYQSCWYEGQITDADRIGGQMAEILGVPDSHELICFLPVGVADEPIKFAEKKPFDQRAWFNGFKV